MTFLSRRSSNLKNASCHRDRRGIVFINANFANCNVLIQQVDPKLRVIVLGSQGNAMPEISQILASSCCQEIYLVAQGTPGGLYLGGIELSLNTLLTHSSELERWFQNPTDAGVRELRLYLCGSDVAAGDVGAEFIAKLGSIVGATIVASAKVSKNNILR